MEKDDVEFIDLSKDINFEKKSGITNFFSEILFLLIAFWVWIKKIFNPKLKTNFIFYDGKSNSCREIKENSGGWRALDVVYNYKQGEENSFADFWWRIMNAQAVRNRLRIVKYLLSKNIKEISDKGEEVRIISIASGSAQGVLESVFEAKKKGILVKAVLIDLDPTALEHAKSIAQNLNIDNQIQYANKRASSLVDIAKEFNPNIIEMVGFLEYRNKEKSIKLVRSIYESLSDKGVFLTSQISQNIEVFFIEQVLNWKMIYRKPKDSKEILLGAGFNAKKCNFFWEPLKIHYVMECKKI